MLIGPNLFVALGYDKQLYFVSINNNGTLKCVHQKVMSLNDSSKSDLFIDFAVNDDEDKKTLSGKSRFLVTLNYGHLLFLVDLFGFHNTFK